MAENQEKINCKISYEDARTVLESEGKDIKDYEITIVLISWYKSDTGRMCLHFSLDGKESFISEIEAKEIKDEFKPCINRRFNAMIDLTKKFCKKFEIEYLASMKYTLFNNQYPRVEATGLRRKPKPEVKLKTVPPPPIKLPPAE